MKYFFDVLELLLSMASQAVPHEHKPLIDALGWILKYARLMTKIVIDQKRKSDESRKNGS